MTRTTDWNRSFLALAAAAVAMGAGVTSGAQAQETQDEAELVITTEEANQGAADFTLATGELIEQRLSAPVMSLEERIAALNTTQVVAPDYHTTFARTEAEALRTTPVVVVVADDNSNAAE